MLIITFRSQKGDKSIYPPSSLSQLSATVPTRLVRILVSVILLPLLFQRNPQRTQTLVNCWTPGSRHCRYIHCIRQRSNTYIYNSKGINTLNTNYHLTQHKSFVLNSTGNSNIPSDSIAYWDKYTVVQLKDFLREKGLKVSGRKADLVRRLVDKNAFINVEEEGNSIQTDTTTIMAPRRSSRKRNNEGKDDKKLLDEQEKNNEREEMKSKKSKLNDAQKEKVEASKTTEAKEKTSTKTGEKTINAVPKAKKAKNEPHRITERDELTKLWNAQEALATKGSYTFKVMSWNVAGLRALIRKEPEALSKLANDHDLDMICLQETKLQEMHLDDPKLKLREILKEDGYTSHWSCSTAKKGYAGTVVFVKSRNSAVGKDTKKQAKINTFFIKKDESESDKASQSSIGDVDVKDLIPSNVSFEMDVKEHDQEGRIITVDYPHFSITNVYVPNSGQKLERLSYRTDKWDKDLLAYMKQKEKTRKKPVVWLGDLNVAHKALDVWNDGAKHLAKQAGTTEEERESFQQMLDSDDGAFVDAFRNLYPDAKGHYSYWSQRAGNREPNKGLRLDYFICSASMMKDEAHKKAVVRDSYMIQSQLGSDHCPIILEIEIKK